MAKGDSTTGWLAFVRKYKELYPDSIIDYKTLMQKYIRGETPE